MKKKILIISVVIVLLLGITIFCLYQNDSIRFKLSYEYINLVEYNNGKKIKVEIPSDNRIKYLNEKEIVILIKEGTGILYFGYNTCPWCRNVVPVLIDTVKENNIDTIYYADIHNLNLSYNNKEIYNLLNDYLRENDEGKKVLAVPDVYFIKNGEIVGHQLGAVDSYYNPYVEMTKNQKQELKTIYEGLIKELK